MTKVANNKGICRSIKTNLIKKSDFLNENKKLQWDALCEKKKVKDIGI